MSSEQEIKVSVKISNTTNPELYEELTALPARSRASRIRILATVGIAGLTTSQLPIISDKRSATNLDGTTNNSQLTVSLPNGQGKNTNEKETKEERDARKEVAIRKLGKLKNSLKVF